MNQRNHFMVTSLLLSASMTFGAAAQARDVLDQVDPLIGTGFHGHTFPGAKTPFGMVQLSPDTRIDGWDSCGGYYHDDTEIWGFSHTHLSGTGIGDYADVLIMPFTGKVGITTGTRHEPDYAFRSPYQKKNQTATPGYYRVLLDRYRVTAELTASPRVGVHRYTFPEAGEAGFIVHLKHIIQSEHRDVQKGEIRVINDREIAGWRHIRGWAPNRWISFHAQFSKPFQAELYVDDWLQDDKGRASGKHVKAKLKFATEMDEPVLVKVGISPVDLEGARKNLDAEVPHWDFDQRVDQVRERWRNQLSRIEIAGGTADPQTLKHSTDHS
jgi:predicted alpha-1,2-mannosidase